MRNENITIVHFLLSSCASRSRYSLHGNLVVVVSHWFLKYSILKLNDVLDAVLSTELCSLFYVLSSMTDRKPFITCGFCVVNILPVIGYNTINVPDIFKVFTLI